jgi:hypothetical protein
MGVFLSVAWGVNAQHETKTYYSATADNDRLKIVFHDNSIATIDVYSAATQKWLHTKVISSDITQEYLKLVTLPESDTLELYRDVYFEKIVLENSRNQKVTYWLDDASN